MEYQFAFACIWAFGGPLTADKVADHRAGFSKWWVAEWKNVSFPEQVRVLTQANNGLSYGHPACFLIVTLQALLQCVSSLHFLATEPRCMPSAGSRV